MTSEVVLGVIHYRDLQDALSRHQELRVNQSIQEYQRVSTLVTVVLKENENGGHQTEGHLKLKVSMTFYDFWPNDTRLGSLHCASVNVPPSADLGSLKEYSLWVPQDPACRLVRPNGSPGITCICSKPGTFALMQLTQTLQVSYLNEDSSSKEDPRT